MKKYANRKGFVELLAPAGSYESAKAAVNAGADAIYMGGPLFSARAYAESSKEDMLLKSIEYCHLFGVKVYMTLNTLIKEDELSGIYEYIEPYYRAGLDAVIVQDFGVFMEIRKHFPKLPLHISTQMTVTGPHFAKKLKAMGADRIVAARELSLDELYRIDKEADIEVEAFIHGALCYCYSGQCLMSSLIGGRSGNRGRCAGTCRLPYDIYENDKKLTKNNENYVLSLKDFNTLNSLRDMVDAGVSSLKIEGRMKSPVYVAGVVSVYRKYLDIIMSENDNEDYKVSEEDQRQLKEIFDRGGSTDGYLKYHNGREMVALKEKKTRVPDEVILSEIKEKYIDEDRKRDVYVRAEFEVLKKPVLELFTFSEDGNKISFTVEGDTEIETAGKIPALKEDIVKRLSKFGNTSFKAVDVELSLEGECFIPVKIINELRREAADGLRESILKSCRRE
ncbi:MAG: U32 family peptidase [Eubacteriales bacterium]|nr:U32 family peptidase [Eubacteriales bacterium]